MSAYCRHQNQFNELIRRVDEAMRKASVTRESQLVDLDGEMTLRVNSDNLTLMIPWKHYKVASKETLDKRGITLKG